MSEVSGDEVSTVHVLSGEVAHPCHKKDQKDKPCRRSETRDLSHITDALARMILITLIP